MRGKTGQGHAIDERVRQETVALAQSLVRIPSANPPGGEHEIAVFLRDLLARDGIEARLIPLEEGRSSLLARIPGEEPGSLVLCGHLDTVAADDEGWSVPPFGGEVRGGRLYGRGTADMKGGVAVLVTVVRLVAAGRLRPRKDVVLTLTADEEGAYRGAALLATSGLGDDAELLLIAEPTGGEVYVGEKGELWVDAHFCGEAAHGSVPEMGRSAVLPACAFALRLVQAVAALPSGTGEGRTSLNVGEFRGGWRVNVVPDRAEVRLDFRVLADEDRIHSLDLVDRLGQEEAERAGVSFSSRVVSYQPPIASDSRHPWVQRFLAAAGVSPEEAGRAPFCTDAVALLPRLQVPLVIYGPGTIGQAHRPDEYVELASLYAALETLARFLDDEEGVERGAGRKPIGKG
jgi:succinyl-diaminopimelate desuccinylase